MCYCHIKDPIRKAKAESMNSQGEWSEWHQRKAREAKDIGLWGYHDEMYRWHHSQYIRLQKEYIRSYGS